MPTYRMPVSIATAARPDYGVNVWHFRAEGVGGPLLGAVESAVLAIHDFYAALATGSVLANGVTIDATTIQEVGSDVAQPVDFSAITVPDSGAIAPAPMAITVNWQTASVSRRGRGRTYVGPLVLGAIQTDGTVHPGALSLVRDAASDLVDTSRTGILWAVGVYGLEAPGGDAASPHVLRDVTGSRVHDRFAWLRSRLT